jgi:hypothetical protein
MRLYQGKIMAFELTGDVQILRIIELLTKTLNASDLPNYFIAIDSNGDDQSMNISLETLLTFAGASNSFNDALFEIFNNSDPTRKFNFSAGSIPASTTLTLTIPNVSGLLAVAGMAESFSFGGQAHGGSFTKSFTASAVFNGNDGNNQEMEVTGDTTVSISNELPGIFTITLPINSLTSPVITLDSSLGSPANSNDALSGADDDINTIIVSVRPNGSKVYTITVTTP